MKRAEWLKILNARKKKHETGDTKSPEYRAWISMKQRCLNPKTPNYNIYGGRGIRVCSGIQSGFEYFVGVVGRKPFAGSSMDRVDNNGNYSCGKCPECLSNGWPLNLRWASRKTQQRNTRVNNLITINGITQCLVDWIKESPVCAATVEKRIYKMGWDAQAALFTPANPVKSKASLKRQIAAREATL